MNSTRKWHAACYHIKVCSDTKVLQVHPTWKCIQILYIQHRHAIWGEWGICVTWEQVVLRPTYIGGQLILEELQVEVKIGLGHGLVTPAGKLGQNARCHVDNEAILTVQQIEEWTPDTLLDLARCLMEEIHTRTILLQQIVQQHKYILNGRVLGQMRDQIQQRLNHLRGILSEISSACFVQ